MARELLTLGVLSLAILMCVLPVVAQEPAEVTAWVDKPKYTQGEKGTLYIAFYNNRDIAVAIKNITILYSDWRAYSDDTWIGNETRTYNVPVSGKNSAVFGDITFTVPTDGRAVSTTVQIKIGTDHGFEYGSTSISIFETPAYMERIISLLTLVVALMVVCTIILAATIFLASRTAQIVRIKKEEEE